MNSHPETSINQLKDRLLSVLTVVIVRNLERRELVLESSGPKLLEQYVIWTFAILTNSTKYLIRSAMSLS